MTTGEPPQGEAGAGAAADGDGSAGRRIEREEFLRGHVAPGEEPVDPRPAATMILARGADRDGGAGPGDPAGDAPMELLLLRRPETARFAPGAWVFPGGVVDPRDRAADLAGRFGPDVTREEPAALVAALREGFEETGVLPSDDPLPAPELARARERLLAGDADFGSVVRRLGVEFRGLEAAYFSRWVTPPRLSRRYDARFFLVRHRGGEPRLVHDEHTEARWITPAGAARRFEAGDFPMLYPTRRTMAELAGRGTLAEALRTCRGGAVEANRPRLLVEDGSVRPVLPDDPRYEEAGRGFREEGSAPGEGAT